MDFICMSRATHSIKSFILCLPLVQLLPSLLQKFLCRIPTMNGIVY